MTTPKFSEHQGRKVVHTRAGGRCEIAIDDVCSGEPDTVHHRVKKGQGGLWSPSNLLVACGSGTTGCHGFVEAHPSWAKTEGLWLLSDMDPLVEPVHMRWEGLRSWWRLDDEGLLHWIGDSPFEEIRLRERR